MTTQKYGVLVTKSELINRLYLKNNHHLSLEDSDAVVNAIIEKMQATLGSGGRIEIRGFGAFSLRHHEARNGRNPKSGESVLIPEKYTVHFKPGKELRERVNHLG
jgi:integration host factor subunit beta